MGILLLDAQDNQFVEATVSVTQTAAMSSAEAVQVFTASASLVAAPATVAASATVQVVQPVPPPQQSVSGGSSGYSRPNRPVRIVPPPARPRDEIDWTTIPIASAGTDVPHDVAAVLGATLAARTRGKAAAVLLALAFHRP